MEEQEVVPNNIVDFPYDAIHRFLRPYEDLGIKLGANKENKLAIYVTITMPGGQEFSETHSISVDSLRPLLEANGWTKP